MKVQTAMKSALSMAKHGIGTSGSNPSVGCVILNSNKNLVASARTGLKGRPHAEQVALNSIASSDAKGGTAFLTLEPCAHLRGKDSCAFLIANSGIKNVYISCLDPDKRTNGKGVEILKKAGLKVDVGLFEKEAKDLYCGFFSRINQKRPQVSLKMATSLDAKIATPEGKSKWITGELARKHGHMQRAYHDAILVGINTVKKDNPLLTCRIKGLEKQSPIRVVVDRNLSISLKSKLIKTLNESPLYIWTAKNSNRVKKEKLHKIGVNILEIDLNAENKLNLLDGLRDLANIGVNNLLVEGGGKVSADLISNNLVDRVYLYRSGIFLGESSVSSVSGMQLQTISLNKKFERLTSRVLEDDIFEEWKALK